MIRNYERYFIERTDGTRVKDEDFRVRDCPLPFSFYHSLVAFACGRDLGFTEVAFATEKPALSYANALHTTYGQPLRVVFESKTTTECAEAERGAICICTCIRTIKEFSNGR